SGTWIWPCQSPVVSSLLMIVLVTSVLPSSMLTMARSPGFGHGVCEWRTTSTPAGPSRGLASQVAVAVWAPAPPCRRAAAAVRATKATKKLRAIPSSCQGFSAFPGKTFVDSQGPQEAAQAEEDG